MKKYVRSEMTQLRRALIDAAVRAAHEGYHGDFLNFHLPQPAYFSFEKSEPPTDVVIPYGTVWKEPVVIKHTVTGEEIKAWRIEYDGDQFFDCRHPDYVYVLKVD